MAAKPPPPAFGGQNHIPTVINCIGSGHAGTDRGPAASPGKRQGKTHTASRCGSQGDGSNLSFAEADRFGSRRRSLVCGVGLGAITAGAEADEVAGADAGSLHAI